MKKEEVPVIKQFLVLASLFVLSTLAAQVAQAQQSLVVTIPFDFTAGNTTLPAGDYSVQTWSKDRSVLMMQRTDQSASLVIPTMAAISIKPQSESKLVFHRYGDRYFLSQVWTAGNPHGRELSKSKREKEIAVIAENESQVTLFAKLSTTHK
jgi:opacity protein-like surface antigen